MVEVKVKIRLVSGPERVDRMPENLFSFRQQSGIRNVGAAENLLKSFNVPIGWYDQKKARLYWWVAKKKKELQDETTK